MQQCHSHIDRHLNEVIFVKCEDSSCCTAFRSKNVKEHFNGIVKFVSPCCTTTTPFYRNTSTQINGCVDDGQPTAVANNLGRCPAFSYKSKTEMSRNVPPTRAVEANISRLNNKKVLHMQLRRLRQNACKRSIHSPPPNLVKT